MQTETDWYMTEDGIGVSEAVHTVHTDWDVYEIHEVILEQVPCP